MSLLGSAPDALVLSLSGGPDDPDRHPHCWRPPPRWSWRPRSRTAPDAQTRKAAPAQKIDEAYTAKIKEYLQDPRITTELVDHLPASATVPTPLKFHGRIVGTPGELTYAKDIHRYFEALDKASDRAKLWTIGKTEEGRDMVLLAIADEATIAQLDDYRDKLAPAHRSAQDDRGPGAASCIQHGEADLLAHQRHALARERRPRDAAGARLPAGRAGDAVHPADPRERHHVHHAGDRGGRPREAGRHLLLQQEAAEGDGAAAADVLGQVRRARQQPRRHGPVPRADHGNVTTGAARVEAHRHARPARGADVPLRLDRHRPVQRGARPDHRRRVVAARARPR